MEKITVPAKVECIEEIESFVMEKLDFPECPIKAKRHICVVIDEMFSNIAQYSYGDKEGTVDIAYDYDSNEKMITIIFTDSGVPFNPVEFKDPDLKDCMTKEQAGGLGIFITKMLSTSISYTYEDGKNILTLTKHI